MFNLRGRCVFSTIESSKAMKITQYYTRQTVTTLFSVLSWVRTIEILYIIIYLDVCVRKKRQVSWWLFFPLFDIYYYLPWLMMRPLCIAALPCTALWIKGWRNLWQIMENESTGKKAKMTQFCKVGGYFSYFSLMKEINKSTK